MGGKSDVRVPASLFFKRPSRAFPPANSTYLAKLQPEEVERVRKSMLTNKDVELNTQTTEVMRLDRGASLGYIPDAVFPNGRDGYLIFQKAGSALKPLYGAQTDPILFHLTNGKVSPIALNTAMKIVIPEHAEGKLEQFLHSLPNRKLWSKLTENEFKDSSAFYSKYGPTC